MLRKKFHKRQKLDFNSLRKIKKCEECGKAARLFNHHKIPLIRGGTNERSNIMRVCGDCHKKLDDIALGNFTQYISKEEPQ